MQIVRGRDATSPSTQRSATFTGSVWSDPVLPSTDGVTINNVFFPPGARTHWHRHEQGQILHVIAGSGLVCSRGGRAESIGVGDTVWVPAGEEHWHGAAPDSYLLHFAVSLGTTEWHQPVGDDDYTGSEGPRDAPGR